MNLCIVIVGIGDAMYVTVAEQVLSGVWLALFVWTPSEVMSITFWRSTKGITVWDTAVETFVSSGCSNLRYMYSECF